MRFCASLISAHAAPIAEQMPRPGNAFAQDADRAGVGKKNAENHPDRGGFPRSIGADEAVDRAARHDQGQIRDGATLSQRFRNPIQIDGCVRGIYGLGRFLERVEGIEPSWPAWKAGALPLSYTRENEESPLCAKTPRCQTAIRTGQRRLNSAEKALYWPHETMIVKY